MIIKNIIVISFFEMNKLVAFMKEHHYVWEANMSGHYTYGPPGI